MLQPTVQRGSDTGPWRTDVARQHDAIGVELNELRAVIASCPATRRSGSYHRLLAVLVSRLAERLATHFAEENAELTGGPLAGRPGVATEATRLQRTHVDLLGEARRLAELLRRPLVPPDAVAHLLHWIDALVGHEIEEAALFAARRVP